MQRSMRLVSPLVRRGVQGGAAGSRSITSQTNGMGGAPPVGTLAKLEAERADAASALASKCGVEWRGSGKFDLHGSAHQKQWMHTDNAAAADTAATPRSPGIGGGMSPAGLMSRATTGAGVVDPFRLMEPQLKQLTENLKGMVETDNQVMHKVARYFFDVPGKRFRPALVLLVAQASPAVGEITQGQQRLAEITEMIHTASLLHDDVMDHGEMRRGVKALNSVHGNKLAILAGDFLLSRASLNLARLRNVEVIELLSTVIAHLVEGEIMQSRTEVSEATNFEYYMRKTYLKTASLLAHSCMGAVLLGGDETLERRAAASTAFEYGKHLGLAFQIQDDVLDFQGDLETLGKAAGNDLREGLTTAPVLFALEQHAAELGPMIARGYQRPGDAERALEIVRGSDGIARTTALAMEHSRAAIAAAEQMAPSVTRDALVQLAHLVVKRIS